MNIVFVLPCFYLPEDPRSTGGTISNFNLVKGCSKFFNVYLVVPEGEVTVNLVQHIDVEIVEVKGVRLKGVYGKVVGDKKLYSTSLSLVRRIATVVVYSGATNSFAYKHREAVSNIKQVSIVRAYDDFLYGEWTPVSSRRLLRGYVARLLDMGARKRSFDVFDLVITNSRWLSEAVGRAFPSVKRVDYLYPPLDLEPQIDDGKRQDGQTNVGIVARGDGVDKGIGIVMSLSKAFPDIVFNIYGNVKIEPDYNENVRYKGWQDRDSIFRENAIIIMPSAWPEPFGRVAIEAQAYGVPVLASDAGGLPEAIINDKWLVHNEEDWIESLGKVLNDLELNIKMAESSSRIVVEKFSIDKHDKKLEEMLRDL